VHLCKQAPELARRELVYSCGRIDPSLKQALVRADMANAGKELLVHRDRFNVEFEATQPGR